MAKKNRSTGSDSGSTDDILAWSEARVRAFRSDLLAFFNQVRRPLPWRETDDPYRIWVSEVMSQQTRIETVVAYYREWMERFPDVESLAEASQEEVLGLWQGLGYYSRARNLHRAARMVVRERGGALPDSASGLRALPGIGPYTAGAVASIALGEAVPAVDGNVRRVLARLADDPAPTAARLETSATRLVDPDRPGDFNQALMELGSLRCTPRSPQCHRCPVAEYCRAREMGTQEDRPRPRRRGPVPHLVEAVAVIRREADGAFLLQKRPEPGLLAGMWECPGVEVARTEGGGRPPAEPAPEVLGQSALGVLEGLKGLEGVEGLEEVPRPRTLPAVDHAFSHRKVTYRPVLLMLRTLPLRTGEGSSATLRWVHPADLEPLPLPVAQRTILRQVLAQDDYNP